MGITEQQYLDSLAGKRVALVASAASVTGSGLGAEVNAHDVVARVNWSCPVPGPLRRDIGTRTDVLYHVLSPRSRLRAGVIAWRQARVKLVISIHAEARSRVTRYRQYASRYGPPLLTLETQRQNMVEQLGTVPNTGVIAIAHLLLSDLVELSLYGFDLYRSGHFVGQLMESPEQAARQQGIVTGHDQHIQRAYLADLLATEPRLRVQPALRAILEGVDA